VGEELRYAAELINAVVEGVTGPRIGLHICRGNWSTREDVLLTGDYRPLLPALSAMRVRQYVLEYATPRAGDIAVVGEALSGRIPDAQPAKEGLAGALKGALRTVFGQEKTAEPAPASDEAPLRELGLGVVNPRTTEVETPEEIVAKVDSALRYYKPEQIFLNTDCGFGCFANRCVNVEEIATAKLRSIVAASRILQEREK
jgi:5-methyltetrahydropteroyltriglutamate--homocysteine methyltransferase